MIIGIDLRVLGSGRQSGIEEYTKQLLAHMLPLDSKITFKLFYASRKNKLERFDWLSLPNIQLHSFQIPNRLLLYSGHLAGFPKIDKLLGGVDIFFSPHFIFSQLNSGVRHVITFHDLAFERFPEFFSLRQRLWHFQARPRKQALTANKIISVSETTRNDLQELYKIPSERITTIHSGLTSLFKPNPEEIKQFKRKNNLPERYILSLSTFEPRKNVLGLINAFNRICDLNEFSDVQLVIAGNSGWLDKKIFSEGGNNSKIILKNDISEADKHLLYAGASLFVYPSFFEGFGFPPLEAMSAGVPVIASYTPALSEIVGETAILVDPYSVSDLANSMANILDNHDFREEQAIKGQKRAKDFSWDRTAEKTLEVLTNFHDIHF